MLAVISILALPAVWSLAGPGGIDLPARYEKWLEEEVVYIISPVEREVFLALKTDRERDLFIDAFWKHRNPTPDRKENDFKTEHYCRLKHADLFLGRETMRPGWKTDRGRIYIIMGEPNDITRFVAKEGVYDCEVWFYQGKTDMGLPAGFNIIFFRSGNVGEYKLYSPVSDGPRALLKGYQGNVADYSKAYRTLREIDPNLANISMSLISGESARYQSQPSMASDMLLQQIETVAQTTAGDAYARKFLQYKDIVDVEYSTSYMDSDTLVKVLRDPSGRYFVHYAIEPKKLIFGSSGSGYYVNMKLNGMVSTLEGKPIYQFEKAIYFDLNEAQMKERKLQPFDIRDLFPLVPGDYRITVLVKNEVSKEFTSLEQAVRIPQEGGGVQMTEPILAYKVSPAAQQSGTLEAFLMGASKLSCQPGRIFLRSDPLVIAFQFNGLSEELKERGQVKFDFFKNDEPFQQKIRKLTEVDGLPNIIEAISLRDFPPAHYKVNVALLADGGEIVSAGEEFDVTFAETIPRPWVYTRILPNSGDSVYMWVTGIQLYNLGRLEEARNNLESAARLQPDSEEVALSLAQVYLQLNRHDLIDPLLAPFLAQARPARYEIFLLAGRSCLQAGRPARALEIFNLAAGHYGVNSSLLNIMGEGHLRLGQVAEARAAWEKSLSLDPEQPEIKTKIDLLDKK